MKFLNLDLDFFISEIVHTPRSLTRRVSKKDYKPWSETMLRKFLEEQCGLSRRVKIPGRFGVHHDAVFDYWRTIIKTATSDGKIDLVHVDAHSDFSGQIDPGVHVFLMQKLLCYPAQQRLYIIDKHRHQLTLANYMSFAISCQWIDKIEFVTHPRWTQDIFDVFFRDRNPKTQLIEFRTPGGLVEPAVPITFTAQSAFLQSGFSAAFLSQSPNYTPATSDNLLIVFEDYIDFTAT